MRLVLSICMMVVLAGCQTGQQSAFHDTVTPPGVWYEGGDGSTLQQAVIIKGATERTGVHAEYVWIAQRYPGYRAGRQTLQKSGDKAYDVLEFTTSRGEHKYVCFDITDFFGKY